MQLRTVVSAEVVLEREREEVAINLLEVWWEGLGQLFKVLIVHTTLGVGGR